MSLLHMNHKRDLKNCEFNCLVSQIRNKRAINIARATGEKTEELNFALRSAATLNIYVQHIQQWTYFAIAIESSFPCPQLRDIQDIRERESGQHANVRSVHLSLKEFTRVHVATRGNVKWRLVNGARDGKLKEISSQQTSSRRRRNIKVNGRNLFRLKLCCEFFFFFAFMFHLDDAFTTFYMSLTHFYLIPSTTLTDLLARIDFLLDGRGNRWGKHETSASSDAHSRFRFEIQLST